MNRHEYRMAIADRKLVEARGEREQAYRERRCFALLAQELARDDNLNEVYYLDYVQRRIEVEYGS